MTERSRLDLALVARGLAPTRAKARDAILRGCVTVDGRVATTPSAPVAADAAIAVDDPAGRYVSRGGAQADRRARPVRLFAGRAGRARRRRLDRRLHARCCSNAAPRRSTPSTSATASFTRACRDDPRVVVARGPQRARSRADAASASRSAAIVADVSFISLRLALPPAWRSPRPARGACSWSSRSSRSGARHIGKGGIVRDAALARQAAAISRRGWPATGWRVRRHRRSPIAGGDGNREFLLGARA